MSLTKEIVLKVVKNFSIEKSLNDLSLDEKLFVNYDDGDKNTISLYGGIISDEKFQIRISVAFEDEKTFLAIQTNNGPIYLVRYSVARNIYDIFISSNDRFIPASVTIQAKMLIGSEVLFSLGLPWKKCSSVADLTESLKFLLTLE